MGGAGTGAGKAVGGKEGCECGRGWTAGKTAGCGRIGGRVGCWAVEEDGVEVDSDGSSVSLEREMRLLSINTAGVGRAGGDDAQHSCRACGRWGTEQKSGNLPSRRANKAGIKARAQDRAKRVSPDLHPQPEI